MSTPTKRRGTPKRKYKNRAFKDIGGADEVHWPGAPDIRMPESTFQYGAVRILNAAGECVKVLSVQDLAKRPPYQGWELHEPGFDPPERTTRRRYGAPRLRT